MLTGPAEHDRAHHDRDDLPNHDKTVRPGGNIDGDPSAAGVDRRARTVGMTMSRPSTIPTTLTTIATTPESPDAAHNDQAMPNTPAIVAPTSAPRSATLARSITAIR
jgi:hypothetical protein